MLVWFATLASKKEIEARLDALEATVAAQNATVDDLRAQDGGVVVRERAVALARGGARDADDEGGGH